MSQTPEEPIYLTVEQAAELLQFSRVTLYRNLKNRTVPGVKICGQWRISRAVVEAMFQPAPVAAQEPMRQIQANGTDPAR